jgi:hypothetical protein
MPHTIKVSVNEWAVLHRKADAELMTNGLLGCVAIAVRTDTHVGLTHVFSNANNDTQKFAEYIPDINRFMAQFGGNDKIREVHIVRNLNEKLSEGDNSLTRMLAKHLIDHDLAKPDAIRMHRDNGCTVNNSGLYLCTNDNPKIYKQGFTNTVLDDGKGGEVEPLKGQLQTGNFNDMLMGPYLQPLPSEVSSPLVTDQRHHPEALSAGVPFERRPSEPAPARQGTGQITLNEMVAPSESENPKKRSLSSSQEPSLELKPSFNDPSARLSEAPLPEQQTQQRDESAPTKKTKPEDPKLATIGGMLDRLPEAHDFRKDPEAASAILAFAQMKGIETITDVRPTLLGNTAIMIEGTNKGGQTVHPDEALRSSEIGRYANPSLGNTMDVPHHVQKQGEGQPKLF